MNAIIFSMLVLIMVFLVFIVIDRRKDNKALYAAIELLTSKQINSVKEAINLVQTAVNGYHTSLSNDIKVLKTISETTRDNVSRGLTPLVTDSAIRRYRDEIINVVDNNSGINDLIKEVNSLRNSKTSNISQDNIDILVDMMQKLVDANTKLYNELQITKKTKTTNKSTSKSTINFKKNNTSKEKKEETKNEAKNS